MNEPEYLSLFSNDGPGRVKVRFVGHPGKIAEQAFAPRTHTLTIVAGEVPEGKG